MRAGQTTVELSRLGYERRSVMLVVPPGMTVEVAAAMSVRPVELEPIEVIVRSTQLERVGFYARSREGAGYQFTRRDLESMDAPRISRVFTRLPSLFTRRTASGSVVAMSRRSTGGAPCQLTVYLDGARTGDPPYNLDNVTPDMIEAMEVYNVASAPIQYVDQRNGCGVVLLWTR